MLFHTQKTRHNTKQSNTHLCVATYNVFYAFERSFPFQLIVNDNIKSVLLIEYLLISNVTVILLAELCLYDTI